MSSTLSLQCYLAGRLRLTLCRWHSLLLVNNPIISNVFDCLNSLILGGWMVVARRRTLWAEVVVLVEGVLVVVLVEGVLVVVLVEGVLVVVLVEGVLVVVLVEGVLVVVL
ncbi:hypothetical protein FOZ63_005442, partial [Perkinsus olseni]